MKKLLLLSAAILMICGFSFGATTLIDPTGNGGFDLGGDFTANGWSVANGTTNMLYVGNAPVVYSAPNCAFSGSSSTTWAGTGNANVNHFYRSIPFPAGETSITLKFRYKIAGTDATYDYLKVWLTSSTPVAGTQLTSTQIGGTYDAATTWTEVVISIPGSYANTTTNLVFSWRTDGTAPNAAIAIDNIELISKMPDPLHGSYTINNTLPTSSPMVHDGTGNFNSFSDAINVLNAEGITAAVTFNVTAGQVFNEKPPAITATGTVTNTVTFQKTSGANPKITPTGTLSASPYDFGFCISGGDYITFDGIDVDASAATTTTNAIEYGYLIRNASATNGAQYNTIKNCAVTLNKNFVPTTTSGCIFSSVSSTQGGFTPSIASGANSYNKYYNLTLQNAQNGVYLAGYTTYPDISCEIGVAGSGCQSARNTISNIGGVYTYGSAYGIYTYALNNVKIFNNDISAIAGNQASGYGIYFTTGLGTGNEIYYNKIQNVSVTGSTSTTSTAYGFRADLSTTGTNNLKVYNNFISNVYTSFTGSATISRYAYGMFIGVASATTSQSYDLDNNSVSIGQGLTPTYSNTCLELQNGSPIYRFRGNIFTNFTNAQTGVAKHFGIIATAAGLGGTGTAFEYNDYFIANSQGTSGHVGRNGSTSTNYNTIADWKTFTTGTLDETSISVDPGYSNNNTDLHASAAGVNAVSGFSTQAWVTPDIDCQDRSTMTPADLGADAFNLNTLDMSAIALFAPSTTGCYTAAQTVTITIKNNGTAPIDFSINNTTVYANVSGAVVQGLSALVNSGPILNPGETRNVDMSATLDMTAAGTYTFNAYTSVVGDGNAGNDAMSPATRTVVAPVALPHVQDFDASTSPPAGWNTTGWTIGTVHANPASGNGLYKNLWSSAPSGQIILPKLGPVSASDALIFDYRLVAYASYPTTALPNSPAWGSIVVEISSNCGASYTPLATIDPTNHTSSLSWATMTYPLSAYAGSNILLRFNATWLAADYYVDFDNIKIAEPPRCNAPSVQTVTNIATIGADLGWTSPDSFFDVFVQGTATPAPDALTTPTADDVEGNLYTYKGGSPATPYYWWVRTDCAAGSGTGQSTWTGPNTFTTLLCDPVDQCNYTFNMFDAYGDGWNGATMQVKQNGTVVATLSLLSGLSGTQTVALCDGVGFEVLWNAGGSYPEECGLQILDAYSGELYNEQPIGELLVGTVLYTGTGNCTPPACPKPTAQTVSNINTSGADLGWTSAESFFDIYVVPTGDPAPTAGSTPTADNKGNPYTWSEGSANTSYDWYVRADCAEGGGTGQSDWTGPNTFTTSCAAIDLPYSEGFESMTSVFNCWSVMGNTAAQGGLNGNSLVPRTGNTWFVCTPASFTNQGATYIHTGIRSAALGYTAPDFNWLISSDINMPATGGVNLQFWIWYHSTTDITKFYVNVFADGIWNTVLTYNSIASENQYVSQVVVPLDAYIGKVIKVAFVYEYNDGWQLAVDDISIKAAPLTATWTGAVNNSWNNSGNWSTDVPGAVTNVIIPAGLTNYPTLTAAGACNNISLGSTATSTATLLDNGFLTVNGSATVERYFTGDPPPSTFDWHLVSSPVASGTANVFFGMYLQSFAEANHSYSEIQIPTTPLNVMEGYGLYSTLNVDNTVSFTGSLNMGTKTRNFTADDPDPDPLLTGWNLMGNPFVSSIDWDAVTIPTGLTTEVHYIEASTHADKSYVKLIGGTGSRYIAPMQGFFVKATGAGSLSLGNAQRSHSGATNFYKSDNPRLVTLEATGNGISDQALIHFNEQAGVEHDGIFDAYKLISTSNPKLPQLYSVTPNGVKLSVNGLPEVTDVPVGFTTVDAGNFSINAIKTGDFTTLSLEDTKTGIFTDLLKNSYSFNFVPGESEQRFIVHFGPLSVNDIENSFANIYSYSRTVYVDLKNNVKGDIFIYNISGQLVASVPEAAGSKKIYLANTGNYIVKVITNQSTMVKKVFIQ